MPWWQAGVNECKPHNLYLLCLTAVTVMQTAAHSAAVAKATLIPVPNEVGAPWRPWKQVVMNPVQWRSEALNSPDVQRQLLSGIKADWSQLMKTGAGRVRWRMRWSRMVADCMEITVLQMMTELLLTAPQAKLTGDCTRSAADGRKHKMWLHLW